MFNLMKMRPMQKEMVYINKMHIEVQFLGIGARATVKDPASEFNGKSFFGTNAEVAACCLVAEIERELVMQEKILM